MENKKFIIYTFDTNLNIIEEKVGSVEKVNTLLQECLLNADTFYEQGEVSLAKTSFGLSKGEDDFIEITCNSPATITCHTDRLIYNSIFAKLLGYRNHFHITTDKDGILEILKNYITFDRKTFERQYKGFLCR